MKQWLFDEQTIGGYLDRYAMEMRQALKDVRWSILEKAYEATLNAERIFVCGNGGSASIANHLACDFGKGAEIQRVFSLSTNMAIITALANDFSYDVIFQNQLKMADLNSRDLVILISSSGNSPNIIKAMEEAKLRKSITIGLCGFDGGALLQSDLPIHIPIHNYGIVEDCHQSIMHVLTQWHLKAAHG
jgi:D-sedoheptulose 7-phosphate isomerase